MKKMIKRIVFTVIIVSLVLAIGVVIKIGKFEKLEGYMYSLAAEITNSATDSNATSSNAQDCATSSNATSSNATSSNATSSNTTDCNATSSNATSSNATDYNATSSNATSSNATSSNAQNTETIKVTNTQTNTKPTTPTNKEPEKVEEKIKEEIKEEIEEVQTDLTYNNSDITQDILENISNSAEMQNVTINLDNNVNISKDVFEAIKGKDIKLTINVGENQIIFNGKNITTPKEINAEISYNLASKDILLKEIIQEGVVINFANNGQLPGKAIIRIKVTDEMKQALKMETILVYHYDEETKELTQMTTNATYKDGFIEFSINHNSKYIFVNELIEEKEYTVTIAENEEVQNEVSFLESHKMYVLILGGSILVIIIVSVILIVDKKTKNKANNK